MSVVEKGKRVGILSDRDLKKVLGPAKKFLERADESTVTISAHKVRTIMKRGLVTIGPEQRAADAAAIMAEKKIGALPVMQKDKRVGITPAADILRVFVKPMNDSENVVG